MPAPTNSRLPGLATKEPSRPRLIDMPPRLAAHAYAVRRHAVIWALIHEKSDDEIYRDEVEVLVDAARLEGCDEFDIEVAVAQLRRDLALILADVKEKSFDAKDLQPPPDLEYWGLCDICQQVRLLDADDLLAEHTTDRAPGRCRPKCKVIGQEPVWICDPPGYEA